MALIAPTNITASDGLYTNGVQLTWSYTGSDTIGRWDIYRWTSGQAPAFYTSVYGGNYYLDKFDVYGIPSDKNATYYYAVQAYSYTFGSGPLSGSDTGYIAPTLSITSNVSTVVANETATVTFTFSRTPTGFTDSDITTTGGTLGAISGTGLIRTAVFTPTANLALGTASITVASGSYTDAAGNAGGSGTTPSISIDTLAPTVLITSNVTTVKIGETATITFTFSEAPTGFTFYDITTTGGTIGAISGSGTVRTAVFTPTANLASGTASITVASGSYTDAAGNAGGAGKTPAISIDTLAPTLSITGVWAGHQSSTITFTFSEAPTGFTDSDITTTGGTLGPISGSGTTRTAVFTSTANMASGTASITVANGSYTNAVGNAGGGATKGWTGIDTLPPTLFITSGVSTVRAGQTATVTFTFSETLTGFTDSDITTTGGTLGAISGSGTTRTAVFTPTANLASGTASITVASGSYTDAAGNAGGAGTTPSISIDTLAPTLSITSGVSTVRAGQTATVTFTFSETPTGFTDSDITTTGGTLGAISGSGTTRTAVFTPTANLVSGTARINVASGSYTDAAGNAGGGATKGFTGIDTLVPTLAEQEATFISGVGADGKVAANAYWGWNEGTNPATYTNPASTGHKFGASPEIATAGGTVTYYFDPASGWTDAAKTMFRSSFALWSAVANISFVENTGLGDPKTQIMIKNTDTADSAHGVASIKGHSGSGNGDVGSSNLWESYAGSVNIPLGGTSQYGVFDGNFNTMGGYAWMTALHEIGHVLGLGHGGAYNGDSNTATQQNNEYDSKIWSLMSYVNSGDTAAKFYGSYPVNTTWGFTREANSSGYHSKNPSTPMPIDILAIQKIYGTPTSGPLSGGQIYGFGTNIDISIRNFYDFTVNTSPVVTLWNSGTNNTLNLTGFSTDNIVNLNPGTFSSAGTTLATNGSTIGMVNNIAIAYNTKINSLNMGSGNDTITGNNNGNTIFSGAGNDIVTAGSGNDYINGDSGNDTLDGGDGFDYVFYTLAPSGVTVSLALTTAQNTVGAGIDTLSNFEGIYGSNYNDTLTGDANVNVISGGAGNNTLDGGGGFDYVFYTLAPSGVTVSLALTTAQVTVGAGIDTLSNFEGIYGSNYNDTLTGDANANNLNGLKGSDTLDGGGNVDKALYDGNKSAYTITQTSTGIFTISGPDGTDTLINVEYAWFDDQTFRLLPGTGSTVIFTQDPTTYMSGIRDFDGNDLGSPSSWKLVGSAIVNSGGLPSQILINPSNGRWAEVTTQADGKVYWSNFGWAGDTRVVGIYIDPEVEAGNAVKGGPNDSQRRFQNDITIGNLAGVLGGGDYNKDGLQEVYFSITDGTAVLHAYMWADGNIQYANYQSIAQAKTFLTSNGFGQSTWGSWSGFAA
jgi:hypothetical protein